MAGDNLTDTIAAISTPVGGGGIGIVRLSGKDALKIAEKIFVAKDGKKASDFKTYTTHYGWIINSFSSSRVLEFNKSNPRTKELTNSRTEVIDEVILTVMRAPKSYTKEDIVEINCHGGIVALRRVLDLVLENGSRLAEPGEFTKRAFLNGRIDLAQAEAVLDIIQAKTDFALKIGTEQLKGALSQRINVIRGSLLDILTLLEANIDFPEEEIISVELRGMREKLEKIDAELKNLLETSRHGRILREGIHVVICGKPNVGKSSLLNALLKEERSIVTPIAGTTRDTIEETIDIRGIPVKIVDTAGTLEPRDLIEKKALMRSRKEIDAADLVIILFDGSKRLSQEDVFLIKKLKTKPAIAVINKIDLKQKIEREKVCGYFKNIVDISAKKVKNIELLEKIIADLIYGGLVLSSESIMVSNLRHIQLIRKAQKNIAKAGKSLDNRLSIEFIACDIREALGSLDDVLGKRFSEDLLDKIFSEFCIGK
ncbi:MAG: tRNA uridine-5-carboxymethylaminomethyl(34) synthesis GTPase MnmE [Candidatus Omnitrophica bacterium CG08_land_8_20_14_0_20_41_16]|uniref:tRNA modification GTPase MnmE n=1 Tax=Candidatus Sherwoodlollariibacterium unditelluris TaxID=1974757 RepID=A0A2G9YME8_9BACT|nr:MAG: tRNA uridine-5-carboxymethylaminomethyl(34) synthesis GTPase MnmE [Candidatus Omnitrophica bacterium CG23_combo_of_CG06-09_8_20_14_all_41_10]PIS34094.1 MAG: tRNA uridine-5-carboxymethylaminomethyl(34) synthesis GTPase MnmE [Candidatus Omnitrophica bacterium CG08_land_8_20_14_0_20_41_16]